MSEPSDWWKDARPILLSQESAGTVGAILAWLNAPGRTVRQQAFNLGSAIAVVYFAGPYIVERLGVPTDAGKMFAGLMLGLLGMRFVGRVIESASSIKAKTVWDAVLRLFNLTPK